MTPAEDPSGDAPTTPPTPREPPKPGDLPEPGPGATPAPAPPTADVGDRRETADGRRAQEPAPAVTDGGQVRAAGPKPGDDPGSGPSTPEKDVAAARRWGRRLAIGAGVLLLLVILGPWLLSRTVLAALIRPALGQGEQPGALGGASMGWNDGLALERMLVPSPRAGAAPWVLLDDVRVEVGLVRAGLAAATGGTVPVKLFVGPTRVAFDQGDLAPATSETTATPEPGEDPKPAAEPKPAEEPAGGDVLPCAVQPELDVQRLDIILRLVPDPKESPLRVELRGLTAKGRLGVDRRLGIELLPVGDEKPTLACSLEELRVEAERPEVLTSPIVLTRPRVILDALSLPADDPAKPVPIMERLVLDVRFEVDAMTVEGTTLRDCSFGITIKDGQCQLGLKAAAEGGRFEARATSDLRPRLRRPTSLELTLGDVELSGGLARAAPYILPLLHATRARTAAGGKAGLPPLSFGAKGTIDLVSSEEGAFLLDDTLDSLSIPDGRIRIAPGGLGASLALDGYMRALAGLGVADLLGSVLPKDLAFEGAEGKFTFQGGRCRFPGIDLASKGVGLRLSGEVALGGEYELGVTSLLPANVQSTPVTSLLRAVDEAGGIRLRGNLVTDTLEPVVPDAAALEKAARSLGVEEVLRGAGLGIPGADRLRGLIPGN